MQVLQTEAGGLGVASKVATHCDAVPSSRRRATEQEQDLELLHRMDVIIDECDDVEGNAFDIPVTQSPPPVVGGPLGFSPHIFDAKK